MEDELVELAIAKVELSPDGARPETGTVTLFDLAGGGVVDIVMARADAQLVQEALAKTAPPRPRTVDLLAAAVEGLGAEVRAVRLVDRRPGGVWVAELVLARGDDEVVLDARPSDALNVALRSSGAGLWARAELVVVPPN